MLYFIVINTILVNIIKYYNTFYLKTAVSWYVRKILKYGYWFLNEYVDDTTIVSTSIL